MVIHTIFRCKFITYFLYYLIIGGKKQGANLLLQQIICYFAVVMKCPFYISLLLCYLLGLAACTGPVILDEEKTPETETEQDNTVPERDPVPIVHEGTYNSPYSIAEAQTLKRGKDIWIEGYIVGCVTGSMKNGCDFSEEASTMSNILLSDTFPTGSEYDYLYCLPIELPKGSREQNNLNLYDNPNNYHRKVRIQGKLTLYFKEVGMMEVSQYIFCDEIDNEDKEGDENETPDITPDDTLTTEEPSVRDSVSIIHEGTYNSPYTIAEAQTLGHGKGVWIEGYIVGSVTGSMKSGCNFTAQATTLSNILLADTFPLGGENDYLKCLPIELPNNSAEREDLNLYDNPDNYHRKVRIEGDITLYYKVVGIKEISDYSFGEDEDEDEDEDENEDENEDEDSEEPDTPYNPDETRQDTLNIAEGIKMQKEDGYEQARIKGYIVGYAKGNKSIVYIDSETVTTSKARENVVLADNIDERDNTKVIIVKLPKGFIRDEVNLYDNPQNLHKQLTVTGMMTPYYGLAGCTETLGAENRERFLLE